VNLTAIINDRGPILNAMRNRINQGQSLIPSTPSSTPASNQTWEPIYFVSHKHLLSAVCTAILALVSDHTFCSFIPVDPRPCVYLHNDQHFVKMPEITTNLLFAWTEIWCNYTRQFRRVATRFFNSSTFLTRFCSFSNLSLTKGFMFLNLGQHFFFAAL